MTSPLKSEALLPITPPSMQPKEVPRSPIETSETPGTAESKSAARTPLQLQQRLIELGYMFSGADGKWGPQSKRALLEYRRQAGLKPGDALDAMTEQSLFSANAPRANCHLLFVGGWSLEPGRCGDPSHPPPVRITETRAETSGGFCIFNSIQPDGNAAWRIEGAVRPEGQRTLPVFEWSSTGRYFSGRANNPKCVTIVAPRLSRTEHTESIH